MAYLQSDRHGRVHLYFQARFKAVQSDTKAHSCLRVASFMDAECSLVEFLTVRCPLSPRHTDGNDATVSCYKDDINIQIDAWVTVLFVFVALCTLCIVCFPHLAVHISGMKSSRILLNEDESVGGVGAVNDQCWRKDGERNSMGTQICL